MNDERDDMLLKRQLDGLPREIQPPEDLWPGVRARISAPKPATRPRPSFRTLRIAALLGLLAVSAGALAVTRRTAATWKIAAADGAQRTLSAGDALTTGGVPARVKVGSIGYLDIAAGTEARLVTAGIAEQRMALTRGTMHAEISAPPRLFVVETPSGTAVDLGCAYTLVVDSAGNSTIVVTAGWVSFEENGRQSLIPAGMTAVARKGSGIGTPVMDDAPDSLRAAVRSFDAAPGDDALEAVLRAARTRDAVTLWHLVKRTEGGRRGQVVTRLVAMVPLPDGVSRAAIERADAHALQLYWTKLPGTLPIIPSWRQAAWKLWLKIAG